VGVVSNIVQNGAARAQFDPLVYLPHRQRPAGAMWVLVSTRAPAASLAASFRREIQAVDSDLPIGNVWTLAEWLSWPHREQNNFTALFLTFAAIALLLASVGLYAVIAHGVSQRTQEIGVRMAVGGTARDVLSLVLGQGMRQVAAGLAIGLTASLFANRLLKAQLAQVSPADPLTMVAVSGVLVLAAVLSCVIPARRAMRVDPVVALRHE
jgi:putative ABC transport system permease protein